MLRRRDTGELVGTVQATVTGTAADLAWVVAVPHQGRGYAREAALAVRDLLRDAGVARFCATSTLTTSRRPRSPARSGWPPPAPSWTARSAGPTAENCQHPAATVARVITRQGDVDHDEQDAQRGAIPIGPLTLVQEDGELVRLAMSAPTQLDPDALGERSDEGFDSVVRQLTEYFAGERTSFDLPLRPVGAPSSWPSGTS